ncbi:hypothetical protein GGI10_001941 [Coemansia sp. RSA 2530]|nr:hypothetical protein GGI10_001941 [Coemansia sp. RSA 2530]
MASLLLTVMIKVPELITNADTLPAEIGALSFRDFFVEKIIHLCAHPASAEALRGHQYNRALSGADTGRGVVLSLTSTTYVDDHVDSAPDDPSPVSPDQGTRDEAIEAIKQLGEVFYISALFNYDEDDRNRHMGAPDRRHITVVSALTNGTEKPLQNRSRLDSRGSLLSVGSGSGQDLGGLGISSTALTERVSAFVAAETQACNAAHSYFSESDASDDECSGRSAATVECKVDPSRLRMDLFRNLIQHKLVYSARKTTVNYYVPLVKSESLFRDIRALDRIHARETIKVAVLYVGPGQWSEAEILSNSSLDTSRSYRSFVSSLGWRINLATFQGFTGKLESNGSDGESCPYYADESTEVAFHEAAAMPKDLKDMRQMKKKRHIGNDHVHIIWNEGHHNYRPETISGDFGNVQIQIRPLEAGEYGIGIYCDDQVKPFGPLSDGMVVSADALPAADISAIQVVDSMFGAAIYDTIVHQLSIVCVSQQQPSSRLALQSLIKQTLADVILHPRGSVTDENLGIILSEQGK